MNLFAQGIAWIFDPANNTGNNAILVRLGEHVTITLLTVAVAVVIAVPLGLLIGHTGKGRSVAVGLSGGIRALPTLGVLTLLALWLGLGLQAPVIAFVILAIPSILAGTYSGVEAIDRATIDAARAQGMTPWQVLGKVEIPLALPLIVGGIRAAVLQVVATVTLAAYINAGGLGGYAFSGLANSDYVEVLGGSILVIVLAIAFEIVFAALQRLAVPAGVSAGSGRQSRRNTRSSAPRASTPVEGTHP
ncbi:ABC transporter permease [Curtobacterium pusillum]|uniref:ABC transporter permease n=1 Tax=Curtobacterium pusillum TaxID=69373 RepID=A0AAW3T566_9MICO|nr:ABC transporter permease [Curtobacterium pusillum]MBA8990065.1 osmoprotectant transport system permease protein [Curtobacterium pusillum]NUU12933.1 ABC transporter permease [Curtobacterium pusillum]GLK30438.1 ABC transporter permease [Curtobacterium pusillum]